VECAQLLLPVSELYAEIRLWFFFFLMHVLRVRCGNSASILEVRPGGQGQEIQEGDMYFNVFEAAPENDRDGPGQQASMNAGGKVCQNLSLSA
jgi:hypothetical protein